MFRTLMNIQRYKCLHIAAELAEEKAIKNLDKANAGKGNFELTVIEAYHRLKHAAELLTEASQMELGGKYV